MIKKLLNKKEFRFLIVGGLNTIVGYGLYALFVSFNIDALIANTMSTFLGVIHSYIWNRFFTFKSHDKAVNEIIRFASVYAISYVIGMGTLAIFDRVLHLNKYLSGLINLVITTIISYFGHNRYSFKNKD